jgi:hypothetical protein
MKHLEVGKETANNIKRTFAGFFAVLHIGWTIIKDVGKVLFDLLGIVGKGSGGFLNFTGGIGDFLVGLDKAISKGNALGGFFKGLENILRVPLELVKGIASAFAGLFGGFDGGKADDIGKKLGGMKGALTPLEKVVNSVKDAWKSFSGVLDQFKTIVDPWFEQVKTQFSQVRRCRCRRYQECQFREDPSRFPNHIPGWHIPHPQEGIRWRQENRRHRGSTGERQGDS